MSERYYEVESVKPFAESLIWQLNLKFYEDTGLDAWSYGTVPHHLTSNAMVGKTYASLILAFLKDLAAKGQTTKKVFIVELGAGHGRLAFHILKNLQKLIAPLQEKIPPFCYVLSDVVEENLNFFERHPQFKSYYEQGMLDVSYFDAYKSTSLKLRYANKTIGINNLQQPLVTIANYFFDSLPNDLFLIQKKQLFNCFISLHSKKNPEKMNAEELIENLDLQYHKKFFDKPFYQRPIFNEILNDYKKLLVHTHLLFPRKGMECLFNLQKLSTKGLLLLSMDKGYHNLKDLERKPVPDFITHGSFSFWVNFHALCSFCKKQGGRVLLPENSTFHLEVGCFLFLKEDSQNYARTEAAYQLFVNDFGPDDFNSIKRMAYDNLANLNMQDLLALFRLSAYDSKFFITLLPQLKKVANKISMEERKRLSEAINKIWSMYFNINEDFDLAYELGGMCYDLGFFEAALNYFEHSTDLYGKKPDIYYNQILCYYQLRLDNLFLATLKKAKQTFPNEKLFDKLSQLDLNAQ